MKVTATEKKLIEAYRGASGDLKKLSLKVLKGECPDIAIKALNLIGGGDGAADGITDLLGQFIPGLKK